MFSILAISGLILAPSAIATTYTCSSSCSDCSTAISGASGGDIIQITSDLDAFVWDDSGCLFATVANITIDGMGHTLYDTFQIGNPYIPITNNYVTIRNLTVESPNSYSIAIYAAGASNTHIQYLNVIGIGNAVYTGDNATIENCVFNGNSGYRTITFGSNNIVNNTYINGGTSYGALSFLYGHNNLLYNNIMNTTTLIESGEEPDSTDRWNVTAYYSTNIIGGSQIGGNYWALPNGTGYSQTCNDMNFDGICDSPYTFNPTDYLPLADPPAIYNCDSCMRCQAAIDGASAGDIINITGNITDPDGSDGIYCDNYHSNYYNCLELFGNAGVADNLMIEGNNYTWNLGYDCIGAATLYKVNNTVFRNIRLDGHSPYDSGNGWCNNRFNYPSFGFAIGQSGQPFMLEGTRLENIVFLNCSTNVYFTDSSRATTLKDSYLFGSLLFDSGSLGNLIYNSQLNFTPPYIAGTADASNSWNTTKLTATNIIGGSQIGGNFYAYPNGTGYSQTCDNANNDSFCDLQYGIGTDYLPLTDNYSYATSPDIVWIAPINNSLTSNSSSITWNVSVSEISSCNLTINGTTEYVMSYSSGYCSYTTSSLTNQTTYCGIVTADSGAVNTSTEQCATVNLESMSIPVVTIYSPTATFYPNTSVSLQVSADGSVDYWWYSLNGGSDQFFTPNTTITASEGLNELFVYANNTAGIGYSSVNFSVDSSPPTITIISPANTTYNTTTILINISSDGLAIWFSLNGAPNVTYTAPVFNIGGSVNGSNTLQAWANDSLGRLSEDSVIYTVYTTAPPAPNPYDTSVTRTFLLLIPMLAAVFIIWNMAGGILAKTITAYQMITYGAVVIVLIAMIGVMYLVI